MSSIPSSLIASCLLSLSAQAGNVFTAEQRTALEAFLPSLETSATVPETKTTTTAEKADKATKPRKTATKPALSKAAEAALLAPAESGVESTTPPEATATATATTTTATTTTTTAAAADPTTVAPTHESLLRDHKHRLATYDTSLCVARKVDEKTPLVGTRKEDEGSNGMFYPEKQCGKKPLAGGRLCKICLEKDTEAKATTDDKGLKRWYGRLDEPLYPFAFVIGCARFNTKYPRGLLNDPSTCPPVVASEAAAPKAKAPKKAKASATASASAKKAVPEEAVPGKAVPEEAVPGEAVPGEAVPGEAVIESVAAEVAPEKIRLIAFFLEGKSYVRDSKTGNVYKHSVAAETLEESIDSGNFAGQWVEGALYKEGVEVDDE